ncbi:hypothetical protein [Sorangium sp. So ce388]|uniref:hypothetical protein n=1 Tax=Sorangium sp. So ce388 TaxID=3133309 RepID=UPI003F5CAC45
MLPSLFCCFPVGLGLLWTSPRFSSNGKVGLTLAAGALALIGTVRAINNYGAASRSDVPAPTSSVSTAAPTAAQPRRSGVDYGPPQPLCSVYAGVSGFKSGEWRRFYEEEWGCIGGPVVVGGSRPSENTIGYHVMGNRDTVGYARLRLTVNDRASSSEAHKSLASYAEKMFAAALGHGVPAPVSTAILSAKSGQWTVGDKLIIVDVDNWPTGKGYDVRVTISLSSAADPRKK